MQELTTEKQKVNPASYPRQKLHKYVLICLVSLIAIIASFPLAYLRVSFSEKYNAGPFNSLTPEQSQKSEF